MDEESGNEMKTEILMSADFFSEKDNTPAPVNISENEGVPTEMVALGHDEENSESMKASEEAPAEIAATSEPEENRGNKFPAVDDLTITEDLFVKMKEDNGQLMFHEESVVFENSNDGDGSPRLHLETPERRNIRPTQEEDQAEEEEPAAVRIHIDDINYEEYMQFHQQLCEDRETASLKCSLLHIKLAELFNRKAWDEPQLEREVPESEQLLEYERNISILTEVKQQISADTVTAQQQAEELRVKFQEKLDKVESEWQVFVALKQDVAVTVLSRHLGKEVAQAKVEVTLATEKLLQDKLIKEHLKHIQLRIKIHRLETELREGVQHARDPIQLQFEQLQAERLELRKHIEKQNEEAVKMQKKISSNVELLSNVKEKLFWGQSEVQDKREQLAWLEAIVSRKRDVLTRTRQARSGLQRDNQRLKEQQGLLGNRALLQDFEATVDACNRLKEQREGLKGLQAEMVFSCGRQKKKLETIK
ncbi:coiled-coil domain-containing protein 96 [Plectropomus leopardus]|uniref:coiled-coil domain-containing protein 96 n=1 Tax=Plectropomus leopardus TaxID=160734 RepID=UPI001C4D2625|nr:coiled-coil domain-containing protein 96 [Plectropomus leopardus]